MIRIISCASSTSARSKALQTTAEVVKRVDIVYISGGPPSRGQHIVEELILWERKGLVLSQNETDMDPIGCNISTASLILAEKPQRRDAL